MEENETMDPDLTVLQDSLAEVRRHVSGIVAGLSDEQMRLGVLPSGWTFVGLVSHLALDVERFWFRAVMTGDPRAWESFSPGVSAWDVDADTAPAAVLSLYEDEARRADAIIAATPLDTPPAAWPKDLFGEFRLGSLREIIMHVVTETAYHAGHLDAARELLDRRQWLVLDEGRPGAN